jgi:hypothetical protein
MPSILNRIPKVPLLHFEILTVKGWVFSGFWQISVRINSINRWMGPKKSESGSLGGRSASVGSSGCHPEKGW